VSGYKQIFYVRLPAAGVLNEGHGNEGFAVIFHCVEDILLVGVALFLPHAREAPMTFDSLKCKVTLLEHGVSQIGPVGQMIAEKEVILNKADVCDWTAFKGCPSSNKNISNFQKNSRMCLPGMYFDYIYTLILVCQNISFLKVNGWPLE
jgi:hypothetical protein